jgi:hypothetical protein
MGSAILLAMSRRPTTASTHLSLARVFRVGRRIRSLWPGIRARKKIWRAIRGWPRSLQVVAVLFLATVIAFVANGIYQVIRKPTELFFPVSEALVKTPSETWRTYESIFRKHATGVITPELLAALAQVEGSGNPVALTYWRWNASLNPFDVYRPASSAVGMYQLTDGTFKEAKAYCIHRHEVVEDGPWYDFRSCWFNSLYMRVVPTHAVEMTSAYLHHRVAATVARHRVTQASLQQKQDLAAVIHLCGSSAGIAYVRRNFRLLPNQRCGDHDVRRYLARVNTMKALFAQMAGKHRLSIHHGDKSR